jgi:hypothetical protein
LVKLYDLAAISIDQGTPLFPDFVKDVPCFLWATIQEKFSTEQVDDLVFGPEAPLQKGTTNQER